MRLNDRQCIIIIGGFILFVIMGIFPPWKYMFDAESIHGEKSAGYALIISPPGADDADDLFGARIDISRLVVQWLVLAAVGLFIWPGPSKSAPPKKPDL